MSRLRWFDRPFVFDLPIWMAPNVVERLRGTPARLEERLGGLEPAVVVRRVDGSWSIQENAGHLADLEPLWWTRLEDYRAGRPELAPADLTNRATNEADHNRRPLVDVLADFRVGRTRLVATLEQADDALWSRTSLHPRLQTPMRLLDLAFFVAEHDDHHLARIRELIG